MTPDEDLAGKRFVVLGAVRMAGLGTAIAGLAIIAGKLPLPVEAGYALFAVGVIEAMIVPVLLARKWKSPPQ